MRIYLTGSVCIEAGDVLVGEARFPGSQGRLAFAMLAAEHQRPVARDELVAELWGDTPPRAHDAAIRAIVSKLRSLLGETGLTGDALASAFGTYQLHLPLDAWVDVEAAAESVHQAESALEHGRLEDAAGAAVGANAITRRPFLPGAEGPWAVRRRQVLASLRLRTLDCLSQVWTARGDTTLAIRDAEEAVALDPFRESSYRNLMRAHVTAGDRAAALLVYERCRSVCADELGVAPSEETEAVYLEILRSA